MTETLNDAVNPQQMILELQRKLDERTAERNESIAQQAATAEILKIIAGAHPMCSRFSKPLRPAPTG
jgi:hypothetical protein